MPGEQHQAVIDLGSNSFRLVAFTSANGLWWKRSGEVYEAVRIGAGLNDAGKLKAKPIARALRTIDVFSHYCSSTGLKDIRTVATSAIREATNREEFIEQAERESGLKIEVLSREEEAYYGYLAAANSTSISNGVVLDLGGGSMQLTHVVGRHAQELQSWQLGAVRMTERFLPGETTNEKQLKALRKHVSEKLAGTDWIGSGDLYGLGGAVRNLAAAAQLIEEVPTFGVQGFSLTRKTLDRLINQFASLPSKERGNVAGIKPERSDIILAAATVIDCVMELGNYDSLEVTEAGLREGLFFASYLKDSEPPLFDDVRRASVLNLANQYHCEQPHTDHVAELTLSVYDQLVELKVQPLDGIQRELLWAAAMLHDIGTTVDYDDHHKHSRYLILNAGLPGYTQREIALIAQLTRYHRKGTPSGGWLRALLKEGDRDFLLRGATLLRLAEQFERSHDQSVKAVVVRDQEKTITLELQGASEDLALSTWSAQQHRALFALAFERELELTTT